MELPLFQREGLELAAFCLEQNTGSGSVSICLKLVCRNGTAHVIVSADIRIKFCTRISIVGRRLRSCFSVSFRQAGSIEIGGVACDEVCIVPGETKEVMLEASLEDLKEFDLESCEMELVVVEKVAKHIVEHTVTIEGIGKRDDGTSA